MLMYNLLEFSDKYSMTPGGFWNCYKNEINDSTIEINDDGNEISNNKSITSTSFKYKANKTNNDTLNAEVVVSSKSLSNFWRFLNLPFINCQIELDLS